MFKYQFRIPELKPTSIVLPDHVVMSNTINTQLHYSKMYN